MGQVKLIKASKKSSLNSVDTFEGYDANDRHVSVKFIIHFLKKKFNYPKASRQKPYK